MPDRPEDFEEAWARIVEELTSDRDTSTPGPDRAVGGPEVAGSEVAGSESTDLTGAQSEVAGSEGTGPEGTRPDSTGPEAPGSRTPPGIDRGLEALFEPLRRAQPAPAPKSGPDPGAFVDNWEDEGHFVPPPPPQIPEGTPVKRLAWAGLLGGPATMILDALTPWDPPRIVGIAAALATLAGFVTLVWLMPDHREDGWDDGARL